MPVIDLSLALRGTTIPLDYGYALFGAVSRVVPQIHGDRRIGVHPIRGIRRRPGRLTLVPQSRLRIRMPSEEIATYLALVGTSLDLDGSVLTIGIPPDAQAFRNAGGAAEAVRVESLRPAVDVWSRLVTLGQLREPAAFEESVRRQLAGLGVSAEPGFLPSTDPRGRGGPERRVIRIKGRKVVGFPIRVSGLTAEESLIVQTEGLGSRRRLGCGLFVPVPPRMTTATDDTRAEA